MKTTPLIFTILLLLAGCAFQQGQRFDAATVEQMQPGATTEQDAIAQLGPPAKTINNADGTRLLQWQYVYGTTGTWTGDAHAAILFGPDHRMIKVVEVFQE